MTSIGISRMHRFIERTERGEALNIGFLGGSITEGYAASDRDKCYASRVVAGLSERFGNSSFSCINAGVGGTGSYYGAIRMWNDLLCYGPDLVIIDFSVNDSADDVTKLYVETFEGVLRRILSFETRPAVLILNNAFYSTGVSVEDEHNAIADHYGISHVSVRDLILPKIASGEYDAKQLTSDDLHPSDLGHQLIADELIRCIMGFRGEAMKAPDGSTSESNTADDIKVTDSTSSDKLPPPVTSNAYEQMRRLDISSCCPELSGFRRDPVMPSGYRDFFRHGWAGTKAGDSLTLNVTCSELAVVYTKTIKRPAPVATATIDGDTENAVILDANFTEDWGDCIYLQSLMRHGEKREHTVKIEITQADEAVSPFYLICLGADGPSI